MGLEFSITVKCQGCSVAQSDHEGIRFPLIRGLPNPLSIRSYCMSYRPTLGYIIIPSC